MNPTYLLDTHTFVWLMFRTGQLKAPVLSLLEGSRLEGTLRISPISCWEIAHLAASNRVDLKMPVQEWLEEALRAPGFSVLEFTPRIAVAATQLPGDFHKDPADRFLVASARETGAILETRDAKILAYSGAGHVQTLAC